MNSDQGQSPMAMPEDMADYPEEEYYDEYENPSEVQMSGTKVKTHATRNRHRIRGRP